jgi:hypothetical protein
MSSRHVILHDEENKPRKESSSRQCGLVYEAVAIGDGAATDVAEVY